MRASCNARAQPGPCPENRRARRGLSACRSARCLFGTTPRARVRGRGASISGCPEAGDIGQYQLGGSETAFAAGCGGEGVADPGYGPRDGPCGRMFAFDLQIALPGSGGVGALYQRTHEREVTEVQLSWRASWSQSGGKGKRIAVLIAHALWPVIWFVPYAGQVSFSSTSAGASGSRRRCKISILACKICHTSI